jgi:hypothetical protein
MSERSWFDAYSNNAFTRYAHWRRWFAWYPVKIDGRRVWLRMVERRIPSQYWPQLGGWRPIEVPAKYTYRAAQEGTPT